MTNNITVYRLKSDNFNCYVSESAYNEIKLQMSTGDYSTHKTKELLIDCNTLEDIKFCSKFGFIDYVEHNEDVGMMFYFYDGKGDCCIEDTL